MVMRIKELREAAGVTQSVLATQMGTIQSSVCNWESEAALPKSRDLPRLAKLLGCSINDLFVHDEDEH